MSEENKVKKEYKELKLFNDAPLSKAEHDALNFDAYADVIYESIIGTETPCTIGVFGEWGMGKTSMMNMAKTNINEDSDKDYISVWFNAWQYEKEEHTIVPLIATIIKEIKNRQKDIEKQKKDIEESIINYNGEEKKEYIEKQKKLIDKKVNKKSWLDKVHNALRAVASGVSVEVSGSVPFVGEGKIALNGKDAVNKYDELMKDTLLEKSLYFDAYEQMEKLSSECIDEKIVIFIDDLDRCLPDKAVRLLENIKLFLSQQGFVFVLGVAREVIESYLKKRYQEIYGNPKGNHGEAYLDKIVQIPIVIPSHSESIDDLSDKIFEKVGDKLDVNLKKILSTVLKESDGNPRTLTRLINRIKINSRISEKIKKEASKIEDKERIYYFAIACSLQEIFPDIYNDLINRESVRKDCIKKEDDKDKQNPISHEALNKHLNKENSILKEFFANDYVQTWLKDDDIRKETVNFIKYNDSSSIPKDIKDYWKYKNQEAVNNKLNMNNLRSFVKVDDKYEFSKYLVTNLWFDEFINDKGYEEHKYWNLNGSKKYLENMNRNIRSYKDLYDENENSFLALNKPIVNVSYFEAKAFCEWLNSKSDEYIYDLPTKEQFEYVASKNIKGKEYPWGSEWDNNKCNNSDTNINSTSVVGLFSPDGDSPFGVCDMNGNVWKWTSSDYSKNAKVIKGGSWYYNHGDYFASSYEFFYTPDDRDNNVGFFLTRTKK